MHVKAIWMSPPDDQITADGIFWQTPEDATLAINGCYAPLRSYYL